MQTPSCCRTSCAARTRRYQHPAPETAPADKLQADQGLEDRLLTDLGFFEVDKEVRRNTEAALDVFRALGREVEEVDLGWTEEVLRPA